MNNFGYSQLLHDPYYKLFSQGLLCRSRFSVLQIYKQTHGPSNTMFRHTHTYAPTIAL